MAAQSEGCSPLEVYLMLSENLDSQGRGKWGRHWLAAVGELCPTARFPESGPSVISLQSDLGDAHMRQRLQPFFPSHVV